ncbi:MAG: ABC transporter permease [Ilumatobacteraceae bacterium]
MDRHRARLSVALAALPLAFLLVFYAWPVITLVGEVANRSAVSAVLGRSRLRSVLWFTCWQAVVSTFATIVVGLGPAYLLARWSFPGRRLLVAIVTVPFLLPTVVVGAAFTSLLPDAWIGTVAAILIAHVYFNVAVVVTVVGSLWSQLPADLVGAARTLGASPWTATRLVTLPLLRPAIVSAGMITFLFTFTSFGVVQILGGPQHPTIEVEIARRAIQLGDIGGAAVLSLVQLSILAVVLLVAARARRSAGAPPGGSRRAHPVSGRQIRWVSIGGIVTAVAVLAPLVALIISSFRPGGSWSLTAWRTLGDDSGLRPGAGLGVDPLGSLFTSLRFAVVATVISVVIGGLASLAIDSARRGGRLLDVGVMLPLGTSAVTIGFGMLITFDHAPVDWRGESWLVPLGHALVAVPFVVRTVLPVLSARPTTWLDAAATLGAPELRAWREIDVRLIRRPLVTAAGLAAAISLGEFGATTFLTRTGQETLPIAIARLLGRAGDVPRAQASALAVILATVTVVILVAVDAVSDSRHPGGTDARRS